MRDAEKPYTQHIALELKDTPREFLHVILTMALKMECKLSPTASWLGMLALGLGSQRGQGWGPGSATEQQVT